MDGPVEIDTNRAVAIIHRYQTETIYVPLSRRGDIGRAQAPRSGSHYRILLDHDVDCFTKLH